MSKISLVTLTFACLTLFSSLFAQAPQNYEVYFASDKHELTPDESLSLSTFIRGLWPFVQEIQAIQVYGHTDSIGSSAYNQKLSENRVNTVIQILRKQSRVPEKQILNGFGKEMPRVPNDSEENRALNRRVEVVVQYKEDRDTVIRIGCTSIHIPKGAFGDYRNWEVDFNAFVFDETATLQETNLRLRDQDGNRLVSGGMLTFAATVGGDPVEAKLPIQANMSAPAWLPPMNEYDAVPAEDGTIGWEFTGKVIRPQEMKENGDGCYTVPFTFEPGGPTIGDANGTRGKNIDLPDSCEACRRVNFFMEDPTPRLDERHKELGNGMLAILHQGGLGGLPHTRLDLSASLVNDYSTLLAAEYPSTEWDKNIHRFEVFEVLTLEIKDKAGRKVPLSDTDSLLIFLPANQTTRNPCEAFELYYGREDENGLLQYHTTRIVSDRCSDGSLYNFVSFKAPAARVYKFGKDYAEYPKRLPVEFKFKNYEAVYVGEPGSNTVITLPPASGKDHIYPVVDPDRPSPTIAFKSNIGGKTKVTEIGLAKLRYRKRMQRYQVPRKIYRKVKRGKMGRLMDKCPV